MKKSCLYFAIVVLLVGSSSVVFAEEEGSSFPFVYDTWNGVPSGQVRLKLYCKNGEWYRNAVSANDNRPSLSSTATAYLDRLQAPERSCKSNSSVGSAYWYPETDEIVTDTGTKNNVYVPN